MSPERISNEAYSFPADLWSLGLALIECATGQYPYDASVGPLQLMIQVGRVDAEQVGVGKEGVGKEGVGKDSCP
jgi:serine/threonine protein kinase